MKKGYTTPKAEKMEFNYSETVVASNTNCGNFHLVGNLNPTENCSSIDVPDTYYVNDKT